MERPLLRCWYISLILNFLILVCNHPLYAQHRAQSSDIPIEKNKANENKVQPAASNDEQSQAQFPIKKGDAFRISVFPDTVHFLNGTYHVDDNGKAFLPVAGPVKIDNLNEKNLTALLDTIYLPYLRYPTLRVEPLIRVSLLGGFRSPGLFYISPSASLWDALVLAGGPVREDGLKLIRWERDGAVIKKNLLPEIQTGMSLSTLGIRSGDQLWVTHEVRRDGWEIFQTDILPILEITVTAASAVATMFFSYETYLSRR